MIALTPKGEEIRQAFLDKKYAWVNTLLMEDCENGEILDLDRCQKLIIARITTTLTPDQQVEFIRCLDG